MATSNSADGAIQIPELPFPLGWLGEPRAWATKQAGLTITAGPRSDWFIDPAGGVQALNAPALLGQPDGDFVLSARAEVEFESTFDAGVLAVWQDEHRWAKLCFEYSPQGKPMVVSVVTRGSSDDCNSFVVQSNAVWLRISRVGRTYVFHASTDGSWWEFVRYFTLEETSAVQVGFEAQSPMGESCAVSFSQITFSARTLTEMRDGS